MAKQDMTSLPLQERVPLKNTIQRLSDVAILLLLLSFLSYRLLSFLSYRLLSLHSHGLTWLLALLCESWFTFVWILSMNAKWSKVVFKTYPERLSKRFDDLPAVDMFVTTADPQLEPPVVTANTVLSLLAVEYPADKLACYVSDDGCSPITFYSMVEASKFAKLWVPFCKKHNVRTRVPFVYFSGEPETSLPAFMEDWRHVKNEYEELCGRIENATEDFIANNMNDDFKEFSKTERGNHETIIKVIGENQKKKEDNIPHLIYVSREKRPKQRHHYKAGAMNVLTRVSGVMTNAPFMLNVDCDMFANNPEVVLHGMCLLLGFDSEAYSGYVQAPQHFHGGLKDDPFGNQMVVLWENVGPGIAGIQGIFYSGTGCFHRRKVIYGATPELQEANKLDKRSKKELSKLFGNSKEFTESAIRALSEDRRESSHDLTSRIYAAKQVASCAYEVNTSFGKEVGWVYGSVTEDVLTGLRIQSTGWRSAYLTPEPAAFLGSAPTGGPASLTQQKRWSTGLLEILFSMNSPIFGAINRKLELRQCFAYLLILVWPLRSVPEFCYAMLPAFSLLSNNSFLPKLSEPSILILVALFIVYNIYTLVEYFQCGLSARAWWNNQRMARIFATTAWLLGFFSALLKIVGLSETIFEVTRKEQRPSGNADAGEEDDDPGRFTFDSSPVFVPGTFLVLVNLTAIAAGVLRTFRSAVGDGGAAAAGLGELVCSGLVVIYFWPFARGLVSRGSYGIPWSVVQKAAVFVCLFLPLCRS